MSNLHEWTPGMVAGRLKEVVNTLAVVEHVRGPSTALSWWPNTVAERHVDYPSDTTRAPRSRATPEQITRMDVMLALMTDLLSQPAIDRYNASWDHGSTRTKGRLVLVPDVAWVLTVRAIGWSWERIGKERNRRWNVQHTSRGPNRHCPGGNSRKSLMAIERDGLAYLASQMIRRNVEISDTDVAQEVPLGLAMGSPRWGHGLTIAPPRTSAMGDA